MKKLLTILLAAVLCLSLAACGGPDKQPAIDAYNELSQNYNEFVEIANEDLSDWTEEDIDFMNSLADLLTEYSEQLESADEMTQEQIDEMVDEFNELNDIIVEYLADEG